MLWELALLLSEQRHGGLLLVPREVERLQVDHACAAGELNLERSDRLEEIASRCPGASLEHPVWWDGLSPKGFLLEQFRGKALEEIGLQRLARLASVDGALIVDQSGVFRGFGVIMTVPDDKSVAPTEGARTRAAILSSRYGVVIKVSEDGPISIYRDQRAIYP
jgi:hypothetical protein